MLSVRLDATQRTGLTDDHPFVQIQPLILQLAEPELALLLAHRPAIILARFLERTSFRDFIIGRSGQGIPGRRCGW